MNNKITTTKLLILYFVVRLFSFIFTPATPLWAQNPINTVVSFFILALSSYWIFKKDERGWYIVAGEIILGGAGGYLKIFGIALRTCLLIISLVIYFSQKIYEKKKKFFTELKTEHHLILTLITAAVLSAIHGLYNGHAHSNVISDLIPYFFLLYLFPLFDLWLSDEFREFGKKAILATIFGNALLILFTQAGLSSGIFVLQDRYYHWYRDIALGKITDLNFNFYRLVLNEHLLLVPLTLYFIADIIKNKVNKINISALACLLIILSNNLTRIYILALAVGVIILFSLNNWKKWLLVSSLSAFSFLLIFTATHTVASRGQSYGLEIFGLRLQSITSPQIEDSSLSRLLALPKILEKIKNHPIAGEGLGDTIVIYSPIFKTNITTTQFDWGYLEIWTEMGLIGLLVWLALIANIIKNNLNHKISLAILISFLVINVTSPALFHVFGAILFTALLSRIQFLRES